MGVIGYLCAIFLTILAGSVLVRELLSRSGALLQDGFLYAFSYKDILAALAILAVLRGVLHYIEQYCNHFIAFKLLAMIRHKVFAALRKLCPAKLEGRDRGNLISIITTDIELLEVFYAHTISLSQSQSSHPWQWYALSEAIIRFRGFWRWRPT